MSRPPIAGCDNDRLTEVACAKCADLEQRLAAMTEERNELLADLHGMKAKRDDAWYAAMPAEERKAWRDSMAAAGRAILEEDKP